MTRPHLLPVLVAAVAACTQSGSQPDDQSGLEPDPRPWAAGPDVDVALEAASGDDVQLSWGNAVAVDSHGRVFLRDGITKGVLVLTPDLRYERTIGREGEGPGEFMHVASVQLLSGDSLVVYDSRLLRVTTYPPASDEPAYVQDVSVDPADGQVGAWYPHTVHKLPGQLGLLAEYSRPVMADGSDADRQNESNVVRRLHEDSAGRMQTDSVFAYPRGESLVLRQGDSKGSAVTSRAHPFGRRPFLELLGDDLFAYGDTREVGAQVVDVTGRIVSSFVYEAASIPVTRDEMNEASRDMPRAMVRMLRADAPYAWPSVTGLVVDNQRRLWLGIRKSNRTQVEWAVFTQEGTHLSSVLLPSEFQLMSVQDDRLIGVRTNDSDVPQVQAYRMQQASEAVMPRSPPSGNAQATTDRAGSGGDSDLRPWASGPWSTPVMEAATQEDAQLSRVDGLGIASDGRIYVLDAHAKGVVVFGSDLTYERTIGRSGRGPGEFRSVTVVQVLPGDSVFVFDADLQRATLFAPGAEDPEYARPVWGATATDAGALKPASTVYRLHGHAGLLGVYRLAYMASGSDVGERRYDVVRHLYEDDGGQRADSLFGASSSEMLVVRVGAPDGGVVHVRAHPFGRRPYWQLMGDDRFVHAHSQEVGALVVNLDGRVVSAFSYAAPPVPVERAELDAAMDGMEPEMARMLRQGAPYSWPPVAALATDDMGRIWLAIRGQDRSVREWAAFEEDGTHVASVMFPARFRLLAVRDGRLAGVHRDDYDVPQIRTYRLEAS